MAWTEITSTTELVALLGHPVPRVADKVRTRLHDLDREWLAAAPFGLVATADGGGRCDVSPKGDPAGQLAYVLDERTLVLAERPGNRRVDGFHNVLQNPHVGLIFVVPGRSDTLRINGRARLVTEAPFFDALEVRGHRPVLALVVDVEEVFYHCAKAFLRSELWQPDTWVDPLPSRAQIARTLEQPERPLAELEAYYGESYADHLYG